MNWLMLRLAGIRRRSTDLLMVVFLLGAVVGAGVLVYFALR